MLEVSSCTKVSHFSLKMFASLLVVTLGLCYCRKDSNQTFLGIPQLIGPSKAVLGKIVVFKCVMPSHPKNESVLLQLIKKDNAKQLGEYTSLSGEAATFSLVTRLSYEGNLECWARAQNNSHIRPTVSRTHYLRVVEGVKEAHIVVLSGPVEFFQGQSLELLCEITAGNNVSYKWLQNGQLISPSPSLHLSDNRLFISRITSENTGDYTCTATDYYNQTVLSTSTSPDVEIKVKDVVSAPAISFTVLKEDSYNYSAVVTCESANGTRPVTFSLYNRTELVASVTSDNRKAIFKLPLVLDQYSGELQCNADNGAQAAHSQWLPLEVVSVGGPVTMHYDSDIGEHFAVIGLKLYCKVAKGSHPRYQWFLNKTLLRDRGSFYYVVDQPPEQSILLLSVGRSSAGTYRCQVSDSFDNTTAISSRKRYLDKEVLNRLPVLVVAVVFGCFTTLILLVSVCCCVGVVYNGGLKMERMTVAYEDELELCEYGEDAGVVRSARGGEFDQTSEASADEWPQIAEQKKTLEDETFEAL
ncbi:platelet endothelial cell adhesion molecule isoform X2 [Limanda limanda]|uniref:platelet endothelial cell adhesion molecule isoform X2 n=1 Tax=Limanda limanda TaxID=27771 RepID=UPI0029C818D2|nr:platelet endothelial cell adhesion molecule isoform X2 [Limanda limanda]